MTESAKTSDRDNRSAIDNVTRYVAKAADGEVQKKGPLPGCDPEDIVQEVLTTLTAKYGSNAAEWHWQSFHAELVELTRRTVRRGHERVKKRRQRDLPAELPLEEATAVTTPSLVPKVDLALDVRAATETLTQRQKEVTGLLKSGYTVTEVAEQLGVSRQTVCKDLEQVRAVLSGIDDLYN